MKFTKRILVPLCLFSLLNITFADTEQVHTTLSRMISILNQINPLINLAEQQEDPNTRIRFQFETLRQDISKIQSGIAEADRVAMLVMRLGHPGP